MDYFKWSGSDVRGFDHEPAAWHASLAYAAFGGRTQVMVPSAATVRFLGKSPLGAPAVLYHRMYVTFPTNLASGSNVIARSLTSDGLNSAWRLRRGSGGTVIIDGPTNGLATSVALAAGTEWRLEWRTSATDLQLRIYSGESTTPFDTRTASASFLLGDNAQFGQILASPALPTFYMRDILITDDGWAGPALAPAAIVGKRSAIIGDSLTSDSGANGKFILDALVARGMPTQNVYLWGVGGKRTSMPDTTQSGNNANNKTTMQNMDDAMVQLGSVDHWLFCLGTNDRPYTSTEVNGYIDTVLAKVAAITPGAKVTWLSLTSKVNASTDDVRLNGLIAAKIAARPNSVYADWDAYIRAIDGGQVSPWWLTTSDSVHMTPVGYPVRSAFQVEQIAEAPPAFTGAIAQTLPALTSASTATVTPPALTGAVAATLPALTQAVSGVIVPPAVSGTVVATLPPLSSAAAATITPPQVSGVVSAILPALVSAAVATVSTPSGVVGVVAAALPALTSSAEAEIEPPGFTGAVVATLPALVSSMIADDGSRFALTRHRLTPPRFRPRAPSPPVWPPR